MCVSPEGTHQRPLCRRRTYTDNRDQPCSLLPTARWTRKDHRRARGTVQQGEHLLCMQLTQVGKEKETGKP